ncbi:hypothetical protein BYT27DRAFT_7216377 [Phlegmacium glaucopus]|nr:hypothetical protein BYT27DRAFT_7216377 [Phlegmacium glaucopus]
MADIIRSAKSGNNWGQTIHAPLTDLDPALITAAVNENNVSDDTYRFLSQLDLVTRTRVTEEAAIDDFARELLRKVGFEERGLILCTRYTIPLSICGDVHEVAQTDTHFNHPYPIPQVIAEAIAAYHYNNEKRQSMDLPTLDTMFGTCPTFYLVPVTAALTDAVTTDEGEGMEIPEYRHVAFQPFKALAKSD